jgi:hypothetical protein
VIMMGCNCDFDDYSKSQVFKWKCWQQTRGSTLNHQQNPKDIGPFDITHKQVKSHSRYLWGLQEPSFRGHEGNGDRSNIHSDLTFIQHVIYHVREIITT